MTSFVTLLQQGNSWLFVPSAVLLGALHGLEPGHSKTMMAAFIVAIRGTLAQAVLLGLSATVSHTAVVWVVALAGLYFGRSWNTAATEPYLQVASAVLIIAVAAWMLWRTRQIGRERDGHHPHAHDHHHDHDHNHDDDHDHDHAHHHGHTNIRAHAHDHERGHAHPAIRGYQVFELVAPGYQDPHELAHANDIRRRFAHREVTNAQIVVFGLTGGLIPCPASITVLLLCLQLKKLALGATLVLCFSVGLALTMVAAGAVAALGVRHAARRFSGFGELARRAPYFSGAVILLVGLYIGYQGLHTLA
ncbi:MAG TPA: nickel/cobalt efflux transporter [Solirubrobacteraceae bacterium]|nr:nickel/cobalt efflux transporter [Solirubrobacteraceae bacterium]